MDQVTRVVVHIDADDADGPELEGLSRQLRDELRELDVPQQRARTATGATRASSCG